MAADRGADLGYVPLADRATAVRYRRRARRGAFARRALASRDHRMARGRRRPGQPGSAAGPGSTPGWSQRMTPFTTFPPAAGARIISLGGYQPANVVTNDDLAARVETSDEWIRSRVGIISRRYAGPDETVADMAVVAGGKT